MTTTTPMFTPAVKERLKARVAIDGPTGSGKTWTALQWARILAGPDGPIGLIDTENRSAAYYAAAPGAEPVRTNWWDPPYEFGHLPKQPPYDPRELRALVIAAGRELGPDGVLVIDSLTHYWNGEGGTLDVVDNAAARSGNSFVGWKEGTPAQRGMLDAIIHAECHVIVTMRSKMEYVLETETKQGRTIQVPRKIGMAPEQRAGVEYEFTVVADMDLDHRLIVSKSRCDLIADEVAPNGRSYEVAQRFADWLATGVERIAPETAAAIVARFRTVEDEAKRRELWDSFVTVYGKPIELSVDKMDEVGEWLATTIGPAGDTPAAPSDDYGSDRPIDDTPVTSQPVPLSGALADALAHDNDPGGTEPDQDGAP
jgi:hypothetical protein